MRTMSPSRSPHRILLTALAAGLLAAGGAIADSRADSWKDESGHGRGGRFHKDGFSQEWKPGKYEWRAGNCKYEFKQDGGGFKEEYKCDGPPTLAALPLERFLPHGQAREAPDTTVFVLGPEAQSGPEGRYCREYQKRVAVGGRAQNAYGTACRQLDGSWELVN